jgi:stearoyl-CoA desaturase (delta-9 desaturase)
LLSHRSWDAPRWYEIFATIIGIFSFTGTPVTRTLAHRYHHAYTDTEKDPHSPRVMDLFHVYFPMLQPKKLSITLVRDIWNDKFHRFIHNHYLSIILSVVLISLWFLGIWWTMTLFVAPGALCWANISLCNILCHYGKAGDPIKQSTLLAWLTFGEGYHRHHHDFPADPDFSNAVGVDPGYFLIKLLRKSPR